MAVIDGVFYMDHVWYTSGKRGHSSLVSGVRLWALVSSDIIVRDKSRSWNNIRLHEKFYNCGFTAESREKSADF